MINSALLYIRVSSKAQEDGYSLDAQEKMGYDYANRKGLQIVKHWKVWESAWKTDRQSFIQLVEYAKKHDEIKHIIFDVTDRMTRNDSDKLKINILIKEYGKTIHFSRTGKIIDRNSGSDDVFMLDIEVAVAKKMSNDISRKTKMGQNEKAAQGHYPSVAPIGYRNNLLTHLIEVDEDRAPFVRKAFTLMASKSYSLSMIVKELYKEGFRGRKGHRVGKSAIELILNNPLYYGSFRWQGGIHAGRHSALISKELFDKAQVALHGKGRPYATRLSLTFNNLLTCGKCGCKVLGEIKKKKFIYYHCTFSKGRHDGWGYVPENRISHLFEPVVKRASIDEETAEWLKNELEKSDKVSQDIRHDRLIALNTELTKAAQRLSRLYDIHVDGKIDEESFKAKETEYKTNIAEIKAIIAGLERINPDWRYSAERTLELSKRLPQLYVKTNNEERVQILKLLASNYTLDDVSVVPTWRKPFNLLAKGLSRPEWLPSQDSNLGHAR